MAGELGRRIADDRGLGDLGQTVEVVALGGIQNQRTGHRVEHLGADVDRPPLLQPRVPGDADTGQLGDLLAAQSGGASTDCRGYADVLG